MSSRTTECLRGEYVRLSARDRLLCFGAVYPNRKRTTYEERPDADREERETYEERLAEWRNYRNSLLEFSRVETIEDIKRLTEKRPSSDLVFELDRQALIEKVRMLISYLKVTDSLLREYGDPLVLEETLDVIGAYTGT